MGNDAVTAAEVSQRLDGLEEAIDALRIDYEKYFLGVERKAPAQEHQKVKVMLRRLEQLRVRSTALRFRLAGLRARLVTFEHYWTRVLGQIERGTYRRDLQRRSQRRVAEQASKAEASVAEVEAAGEQAAAMQTAAAPQPGPEAAAPGKEPGPRAVPPPPPPKGAPPPVPVPGMRQAEVHTLFQNLVQAKRAAGEATDGLTVRALARKLSRELPKLRALHGGPVAFEVSTVGGKVRLRARPVGGK